MKKWLKRIVLFIAIILLTGFLFIHFQGAKMTVFIDDVAIENPMETSTSENFTFLSDDSLKLTGHIYNTTNNQVKGTVIMLHGIRSNQNWFSNKAKELNNAGYNCVTMNHRAHGTSEGDYCTFGVKEKDDVSNLLDFLSEKYNLTKNIGVWGQSLGGAIAIQSLANDKRLAFGIIESTFTSMHSVVGEYFKRFAGFELDFITDYILSRSGNLADFDTNLASPLKSAENITQPILMVHGTEDERINISNGKAIFAKLNSQQKEFYEMKGANHTTVWQTGKEAYAKKVITFLDGISENQF